MWNKQNGIWKKSKQNIAGVFVLNPGQPNERRIRNTIVEDGAIRIAKLVCRAEATLPAAFHLGLTNATYAFDDADLTDIEVGEPSGNGYARQTLTRDTTDWNTPTLENNAVRVVSKEVTFTASAAWDKPWSRMFLANVASGAGVVFAISGSFGEQTVLSGAPPTCRYEMWIRA